MVVSFLIIGYFVGNNTLDRSSFSIVLRLSVFRKPWFSLLVRLICFLLFVLTVATGIWGEDAPTRNFNMTFFWIIFTLGFAYLTAILGNIWNVANPWKIVTETYERITDADTKGVITYPSKLLGYYPALIFYFLFISLELIAKTTPPTLSWVLLLYTLLNFGGIFVIGKKDWFEYCEFFSVFFRLISLIAPFKLENDRFVLKIPFAALLDEKAAHFSLLLFILFMLSSTAYDGFRETQPWYDLYLKNFSELPYQTFQLLGLLLSPVVFLVIYIFLILVAKYLTKSNESLLDLSLNFALSLIPIAFVYNVAHYYTLLLIQGQAIFALISDPFVFGWNLFGTVGYKPNIGLINANFVWHSQLALILVGHIAAVFVSHVEALKVFSTHRKAILSQFPMLLLMVTYTIIGLWILSQPITKSVY